MDPRLGEINISVSIKDPFIKIIFVRALNYFLYVLMKFLKLFSLMIFNESFNLI